MNRIKHQEKGIAQGECSAFLEAIGARCKNVDNPYYQSGVPDYDVAIPNGNSQPMATLVEVKAGGIMFPFSRIEDHQWSYMHWWQERSGGVAWFWLLVGTEPVNSKGPFRKQVYLAPYNAVFETYSLLMSVTEGVQSVMPMNRFVPRLRNKAWYHDNDLFIDTMLAEYAMMRIPGKGWWPNPQHKFLKVYPVEAQPYGQQLELFSRN